MVAKVTMAKTRVYADEPQVYIVSGLGDNEYANYFKFARYRYTYTDGTGGGTVLLNQPGKSYTWEEISDSSNFDFDAADIPAGLPTAWSMDGVRQALAEGAIWKVIAWNAATGTMAVYGAPRGVRFPKYRYELFVRNSGSGDAYNHEIEWSVIQEDMPESLRQEYMQVQEPPDLSLKLGDLAGRHLIVNNIQDVSAGVEVAINNNSSHTGTAIVHVEIRDSAGLAIAVAEDASAHFDPAPFMYVKTWPVITLLQPSTNYTVHYSVFDSANNLLLSGGGVSFRTNAAPVQVTPLDITGISATKTTLAKGESVTFTITHNNGGLKPVAWSWYLNGGPFSGQIQGETATTMQTTLQEPGIYIITGQGVDAAGDGDYAEVTITVTDSTTPPPATGKSGAAVAALLLAGAYALSKAGKGRSVFRV